MSKSSIANKPVDMYLISSTLHFFWAYMLAKKYQKTRESHLIVIDQYANNPLLMMKYLHGQDSPFETVETWTGRELKGLDKLQNRKHQFIRVQNYIQQLDIERVFIGNDRSVVGQFFIKKAKHQNTQLKACFMDDGVYSYLGRPASKSWTERYSNAFFKKLAYGFWYDVPETIGASKWIDQAWVMYPKHINKALNRKKVVEILPDNNGFDDLRTLSQKVFKGVGIDEKKLQQLDFLITLPNETVFSQYPDYRRQIRLLVSGLLSQGKRVGIKYHPAAGKKDLLSLEKLGAIKFPANLSYELLIPYLANCTVIGDFSTTVLISQYAQNIQVNMLDLEQNKESGSLASLCEEIGVKVEKLHNIKQTYNIND